MSELPAGVEPAPELHAGLLLTASRTITAQDIAAFAELVGDQGQHHLGQNGTPMAHGLLVVSLATRIGGRFDFIADRMDWKFRKPVWAGTTITARVTVTALTERRSGQGVHFDVEIVNDEDVTVATGEVTGIIRR